MKGLICKDLCQLWEICLGFGLFAVVGCGLVCLGLRTLLFLFTLPMFFGFLLFSAFSADESSRWNLFARTLPVSPLQCAAARGITGLILLGLGGLSQLLLGGVLGFGLGIRDSLGMVVYSCLLSLAAMLVFCGVMMPLCLWLGVERAQIVLWSAWFVFCLGITALGKISAVRGWPVPFLSDLSVSQNFAGLGRLCAVCLVVGGLVYLLCIRISAGLLRR